MQDNVFKVLGASNHTERIREQDDWYATDKEIVKILLQNETFDEYILENSVGSGNIADVLIENGYKVKGIDIKDRGWKGTEIINFLEYNEKWNGDIICNPPYKVALEFAKHSLELIEDGHKLAMLLKIQFLEGKERKKFFEKNPPKYIYVFSYRVKCAKNNDFSKNLSSAVCYCWYLWEKGYKGEPKIKWL